MISTFSLSTPRFFLSPYLRTSILQSYLVIRRNAACLPLIAAPHPPCSRNYTTVTWSASPYAFNLENPLTHAQRNLWRQGSKLVHSSVRHKRRLRQTRFCECEGDTVDKSRFAVFFSSWLLLEPGGVWVGVWWGGVRLELWEDYFFGGRWLTAWQRLTPFLFRPVFVFCFFYKTASLSHIPVPTLLRLDLTSLLLAVFLPALCPHVSCLSIFT